MTRLAPIPVVCAVIEDATGHILLAQRPAHKHLGLKWEFPGGKVERDEPPERALIREIAEELDCSVDIVRALPPFMYDYGTVVIEMLPYVCVLAANSRPLHPHEHVAVVWVTREQLKDYDLAPADWPVVETLNKSRL